MPLFQADCPFSNLPVSAPIPKSNATLDYHQQDRLNYRRLVGLEP